jgi:hypothetical protein
VGGLFQRDLHGIAEIVATVDLAAATTAPATLVEHVAEDVAKGFGKAAKALGASAHAAVGVHARMAVLVVGRALVAVGEHLVGLFDLLEFLLGLACCITLIAVGVVLHRQLAIGLLDVVVRGVLGNAQDLVVIAFGHGVC